MSAILVCINLCSVYRIHTIQNGPMSLTPFSQIPYLKAIKRIGFFQFCKMMWLSAGILSVTAYQSGNYEVSVSFMAALHCCSLIWFIKPRWRQFYYQTEKIKCILWTTWQNNKKKWFAGIQMILFQGLRTSKKKKKNRQRMRRQCYYPMALCNSHITRWLFVQMIWE